MRWPTTRRPRPRRCGAWAARWAPTTRRPGAFDLARRLIGARRPRCARSACPADGLDRAADLATQTPYPNPRPLDRTALRALLQRAYDGASLPLNVNRNNTMSLNRRTFVHGVGAAAALGSAKLALAADTLKIGYVSPQTGPLAPFGEADKWVIDQMKAAFRTASRSAARPTRCRSSSRTARATPNRAGEVANDLILGQGGADPHRRHAGDGQPGQRRLRAQRAALHLVGRALAAVVLRPARATPRRASTTPTTSSGAWKTSSPPSSAAGTASRPTRRSAACSQRRRRQRLGRQGARLPQTAGGAWATHWSTRAASRTGRRTSARRSRRSEGGASNRHRRRHPPDARPS